jgi:hypothetical protein
MGASSYLWGWSGTESTTTEALYCPIVPALDDSRDNCGALSGKNDWQGTPKYTEETCPDAAVSSTDPTLDLSLG